MTVRTFLRAARRRWYVVVLGALLTVAALGYVHQQAGVYYSRVTLVVITPESMTAQNLFNRLLEPSPTAIAAIAVMDVNQAPNTLHSSRAEATLYGMGEEDGVLIQVRNSGSQWTPNSFFPYIDIDATGPSEAVVEQRIQTSVAAVTAALDHEQDALGIGDRFRTVLQQSPPNPAVQHIAPAQSRALAATALVGLCLTGISVQVGDRPALLRARRRRTRARLSGRTEPVPV